jgi:predicted ATPase/class 3 adenylate cyclase
VRKELPTGTVTFLFTDVEGSTRLLHELGAERYAEALAEHRRVVREACAEQGGVEVDTQGDAFFVAFPTAPGALEAARRINEGLDSGPIRLRMGLHTGTPLVTDEGYVGEDVHFAARVGASGHGGQVLLSQTTREILDSEVVLSDLGEHRLKDVEGAVPLVQLGSEAFPPLKTISNTNLPRPASSFVGREAELGKVLSEVEQGARLLTLSGPGGSGKTRLALEAATTLVPEYRAGVFWLGLAALRDPSLVTEQIAQTLGAKDELAEHIGEREMLLLIDNLEQVVEAAPELSRLLKACPNLTLLCTSRELLRVQGEVEYAVPPLASPEAVSLFCERSRLEPSDEIAKLCARVDNLPLAVELAAARTKALSPAQILDRLKSRLDLLKGGRDADPRQQTLRATIGWSYELLSEEEQRRFRALSVFAGGCTLEAAEEVADASLDTLQSLVEKSLLRFTDERYWMLETIREYAGERLQESGEVAPRLGHAEWFCELAERLGGMPPHRRLDDDFGSLPDEMENVRSALAWAWENENDELALRFGPACIRYWMDRALFHEATSWLEQSTLRDADAPPRVRLDALRAAGVIAFMILADTALADERWSQALTLAKELPDTEEIVWWIERMRAGVAWDRGDLELALALLEQNLAKAREKGSRTQEADVLVHLGALLGDLERSEEAQSVLFQAEEVFLEVGDHVGVAMNLQSRGDLALDRAELSEAADRYYEFLEALDRLGGGAHGDRDVAYGLAGLASVLAERGRDEDAARIWGAVCAAEEALGFRMIASERRRYERRLVPLEDTRSWIEGRALTLEEAAHFLRARLRRNPLERT